MNTKETFSGFLMNRLGRCAYAIVGLGTLICIFGTGTVMNVVFGIQRFNPRDLVHESLIGTIKAGKKALESGR